MKTCSTCQQEKHESEFSKCKKAKDGLQWKCKVCVKQWQLDNKDKRKAWRHENREKLNTYNKQWRENNQDKIIAWRKQCPQGYKSWDNMIQRCHNPNHHGYHYWGGRGIEVCDEWRGNFDNFYRDMGNRPAGKSIDRIDNDGDYCKENCKWSTAKEQAANRRPRGSALRGI